MVETIIKWSLNGIYKADPTKCYEEIQGIGDEVTPRQVLDRARNKRTDSTSVSIGMILLQPKSIGLNRQEMSSGN